jgi:hypothetical protein
MNIRSLLLGSVGAVGGTNPPPAAPPHPPNR